MDPCTKTILTVIAVALCAIALKFFFPTLDQVVLSLARPTFGDLMALREIQDREQRRLAHVNLVKRLPLVQIQGGQINADVSGSVSIDR
jgi:hypothetical protein